MSKRYLLIGARINSNPKSFGGTTVLMEQLIDYFKLRDKEFIVIETNRYSDRFSSIKNGLYLLLNLVKNINKIDIIFINASKNGTFILAPILFLLAKLFKKRFIFRKFGGGFIELYHSSSPLNRLIVKNTIFKSDIIFVETKEILNFVREFNKNTYHFPNSRKFTKLSFQRGFKKRFVFISAIKESKGINEILEASKGLDNSYRVDIYGPIVDKKYLNMKLSNSIVSYKGVIEPKRVLEVLVNYDVLLLPTYHKGEGYPGIIIEAFSLKIPVIATNWQAISEIVIDGKNGILIPPKSSKALLEAIKTINDNNYKELSKGALDSFREFEFESVHSKVFKIIEELESE